MTLSRRTLMASGAGAAAAAVSLAGCSQRSGTGPDMSLAAEVPRHPVTIHWWSARIARKDGGDLRASMIREFNKRYPQITVRRIQAPATTDTARAALTTQLAAGSPSPDVYMGDSTWPAQFAYNEMALPLDELVGKDHWQRYPEAMVQTLTYRGTVYAFPLYMDQAYLYYRKDLLHKHGLPVPRSWEELARTASAIQKAGDADYGFVWQGSVYEGLTCNVAELVADAGGSILSPDGTRVTFDGPGGRRAVGYLRELVARGVSPSSVATFAEQESLDAFTSGRSVFMRNWPYAWGVSNNPGSSSVAGRIGAGLRPGFEGGPSGQGCLGGWCTYVNPHSKNLGAAVAFARFMADEEGQMLLAREGSVLPPLKTALNSRAVRGSDNPTFAVAHQLHQVSRPTQTPHYPQVSKVVYTHVNAAFTGGTPVSRAVSAAGRELRAALRGDAL